jgi:SAM-dependent methyltransferase
MSTSDQQEESINGLELIHTYTLSHEERAAFLKAEAENRLKVFGAERLAEVEGNLPDSEAVDGLTWKIEELCMAPQAHKWHGVYTRSLESPDSKQNLEFTWNPAGIVGGFDGGGQWDRAVASIGNLKYEHQLLKINGRSPHRYTVTEGLFIDRDSGMPMIARVMWSESRRGYHYAASKPATAHEVRKVTNILQRLSGHESGENEAEAQLPIHLEIGYGLDPGAILTKRSFKNKMYVGVDRAVGDYQNSIGTYPEAVRMQSKWFANLTKAEKAGQQIHFMLGDGMHLPFPDHSIREVFMSNVLNADVDEETRTALIKEAHRVLEKDGNIIVRINWNRGEWQLRKMVDTINENDFHVFRSVRSSDPEYPRMEAQYGTPKQVAAPDGYYLIAEPSTKLNLLADLLDKKERERIPEILQSIKGELVTAVDNTYSRLGALAANPELLNKEIIKEMEKAEKKRSD